MEDLRFVVKNFSPMVGTWTGHRRRGSEFLIQHRFHANKERGNRKVKNKKTREKKLHYYHQVEKEEGPEYVQFFLTTEPISM